MNSRNDLMVDATSLPVLPNLPGAESWRESTQLAALHPSPLRQSLDEALEMYENSFRRYSSISQAYYVQLNSRQSDPEQYRRQGVRSAREQAEAAFSLAIHDFEAVEVAFNIWTDSPEVQRAVPEVRQLQAMISTGRSQLDASHPARKRTPRRGA